MGMSQDEIDRLMTEQEDKDSGPAKPSQGQMATLERMAKLFSEAVNNIVPILAGEVETTVALDPPESGKLGALLEIMPKDGVYFAFKETPLTDSPFIGVLDLPLALGLSQRMMGQEGAEELNEALLSALNEALGNILGAFDASMKEEFNETIEHSDLKFLEGDHLEVVPGEIGLDLGAPTGMVTLTVGIDETKGKMGILMGADPLAEVHSKHPSSKAEEAAEEEAEAPASEKAEPEAPAIEAEAEPAEEPPPAQEVPVARFEELVPRQPSGEAKGIELILDVPLAIAVELGRKSLSVREILELVPGSLVELDKLAGEAVDLLVNGKLFAKGEVVVIDENFGVRVSSIVSPKERLDRLK